MFYVLLFPKISFLLIKSYLSFRPVGSNLIIVDVLKVSVALTFLEMEGIRFDEVGKKFQVPFVRVKVLV